MPHKPYSAQRPDTSVDGAVTTGIVARRLGVAPTTIRSWERRYALGPVARQQGRHRRWTAEDIARLEYMCQLTGQGVPPAEAAQIVLHRSHPATRGPQADTPQDSPATPPGPHAAPYDGIRQECRGLARAAARLDTVAVRTLLDTAVSAHGLVPAWEQVFAPTLHSVGRQWATTASERHVEVEHLLSWEISCALRRLPHQPAQGGTAPVILACAPDEQHSLPLEALTAALGERGVPARMFGAALPAESLHAAVRRIGPSAVLLWAHAPSTADHGLVRRTVSLRWGPSGARVNPTLFVAGPGWGATTHGPDVKRLHTLAAAVDTIEALLRDAG
ncbi:MerR family transcriptional regulator [Streptomyces sp. NPDC006733]|uniref:MerR family transcriptional regulator n=1 Tax=Streptomyces sp. NPDC006733 TaxID=3155460 RepID=UPI0033FD77B9